jgi:hypothetical protein
MVTVMLDTNLVAKVVGQPLPAKLDPLRRVRGRSEMARVVGQAERQLAREGKPVFIVGDHYGITSLLTFYLPEAKARVTDAPVVFCQPTEIPENQYYFWPDYTEAHQGQNALFIRDAGTPKLLANWLAKWWHGEASLLTQPLEPAPAPTWLVNQFDSVTNMGLYPVFYRGRVLHTLEIFECRNLR